MENAFYALRKRNNLHRFVVGVGTSVTRSKLLKYVSSDANWYIVRETANISKQDVYFDEVMKYLCASK